MKKIFNYIKDHKISLIILLALILGISFFVFRGNGENENTYTVRRDNFVKSISISGKVIPSDSVDLAFESGGTVFSLVKIAGDKVSAGEVIVALDSRELRADRDKAQADLEASIASLNQVKGGTQSGSELESNKQKVINSIIKAYTASDDVIHAKTDEYFDRPRSTSPRIKDGLSQYTAYNSFAINKKRAEIETTLTSWNTLVNSLSISNYTNESLDKTKQYIGDVKNFLDILAPAVNSFEAGELASQTEIDKYKNDLFSGRTNINEAISDLVASGESLRSSASDIPIKEANVKAQEAVVANLNARLAKTYIIAPFSGVVSVLDAKVGESVSANQKVVSLISTNLEIEAFIPEVSIPGITVGNSASVVLDAYPDAKFEAKVFYIDPAETLKDGVSNYKIKLSFTNEDPRIKPGMTADVAIETEKRADVLIIPERTVLQEDGVSKVFVKIEGSEEYEKREIKTLARDGRGNIEIESGLNVGDEIKLNPEE